MAPKASHRGCRRYDHHGVAVRDLPSDSPSCEERPDGNEEVPHNVEAAQPERQHDHDPQKRTDDREEPGHEADALHEHDELHPGARGRNGLRSRDRLGCGCRRSRNGHGNGHGSRNGLGDDGLRLGRSLQQLLEFCCLGLGLVRPVGGGACSNLCCLLCLQGIRLGLRLSIELSLAGQYECSVGCIGVLRCLLQRERGAWCEGRALRACWAWRVLRTMWSSWSSLLGGWASARPVMIGVSPKLPIRSSSLVGLYIDKLANCSFSRNFEL